MDGTNPSFDKISQKLNTTFEQDLSAAETEIQAIDKQKQQIQQQITNKESQLALKDQEYLLFEIKNLINRTLNVLDRLDQDIKIGTEARKYEVFAALTNSITSQIKELRELNKMIIDVEMFKGGDPQSQPNVKVEMNGRDLFEFWDKIRNTKQIDDVDVTFQVEADDPEQANSTHKPKSKSRKRDK